MTKEVWKPVSGWETFYEVSDLGRVRTVERTVIRRREGKRVHKVTIPSRIRKTPVVKRGYPTVSLKAKGRKQELRPVHHLVTRAFLGPIPDGYETRHLDGNKKNNHLSNLMYGTQSENQADRVKHGTSNRGEQCGSSRLTSADVQEIRKLGSGSSTQKEIAQRFGISREHARDIINRKRWGWL